MQGLKAPLPVRRSIRRQLLAWLLIPLAAIWLIDFAVANFLAVGLANDAYDESLIDSAEALASRFRTDFDPASVKISNADFLKFNRKDAFFYQIRSEDQKLVAGDQSIPAPNFTLQKNDEPDVRDATIGDHTVRVATIRIDTPSRGAGSFFIVQVAETVQARNTLILQVILNALVPQVLQIVLASAAIFFGVKQGLLPLRNLQRAVEARSPSDLRPVTEKNIPNEVQPLVASINSLLKRVEEDRDSQRRFVANAAHQLRTPLAGLKTQAQLAQREAEPNALLHALQQIEMSANRANRLIRQLLALARVEPSVFNSISICPVDLTETVKTAIEELLPLAIERDIDLGCEIDLGQETTVGVEGDAESLHELVTNLIENAIQYTQAGGRVSAHVIFGTIAQPSGRESRCLKLIVEDDGPGIAESERERVFERFYRVLGTGVSGSGLGLAIVREIADSHAASVSISSGPGGKGTAIEVVFTRLIHLPKIEPSSNLRSSRVSSSRSLLPK
jgi:two-component system sensor histidine kinase TctE